MHEKKVNNNISNNNNYGKYIYIYCGQFFRSNSCLVWRMDVTFGCMLIVIYYLCHKGINLLIIWLKNLFSWNCTFLLGRSSGFLAHLAHGFSFYVFHSYKHTVSRSLSLIYIIFTDKNIFYLIILNNYIINKTMYISHFDAIFFSYFVLYAGFNNLLPNSNFILDCHRIMKPFNLSASYRNWRLGFFLLTKLARLHHIRYIRHLCKFRHVFRLVDYEM